MLFTSFMPEQQIGSIGDMAKLIPSTLGLTGNVDPEQIQASIGVFDIASPLFSWVDGLMSGWLPDTVRLVFWGIVAGVVSMGLYRLTSNQARLAAIKTESVALRREMAAFDGPFAELWTMVGRNLALSMRQIWITLGPAVIASVPLIFLLVWLSNTFDARMPAPGDRLEVAAHARAGQELPPLDWRGGNGAQAVGDGAWNVAWPEADKPLELVDADGTVLLTLPTEAPVGVVHQHRWWNVLLGNPAGYLPSPGAVDAVEIGLPKREYLPFGPGWMRGWIPFFFGVVIVVSLLLKFLWRLH